MLELRDPKLQLVQIVPRNEIQVLDEAAQERHRVLARSRPRAADPSRKLAEQLFENFGDARTTGHGRAASSAAAAGASRAAPAPRAPTDSP